MLWTCSLNADIISSIKSFVVPSTNIETYGIWSEKQSNLGHEIWKKSSRTTVEELLSAPWPVFSSPTLYKLALRVLLTSTEIPAPENSPVNLLELRAQRLYELGEITYAFELIKGFGANINPLLFNKIKFSALLAQQKYEEALKIAMVQAPKSHEVFWQEAIIFCQLFNPTHQEAARLALSLYQDNPKIADPEFVLLAEHILGKKHKKVPVSSTHSFMKILLRLEANLLPDSLIAMVSPRYLALLQTYPGFGALSLSSRIRIQERIALFLPPTSGITLLQTTYIQASTQEPCPFDAAADPLGGNPIFLEDTPLVRAHLFHLLSTSTALPQKTAYASLLLRNALQNKLLVPIAHLTEPFLKDLKVIDPSVKPYILLANTITQQKLDIASDTSHIDDPALLTTLLLYYPTDGWDKYLWENKSLLETSPHKYILLGIIYPWHKALGHKLAIAIWKHRADFDPELYKAPFLLNFLLGDAQVRKQKGETIVLALLLSSHEDKSKSIGSLPLILRTLLRAGLQQEALDLAMEKLTTMLTMPDLVLTNPLAPIDSIPKKPVVKKTNAHKPIK